MGGARTQSMAWRVVLAVVLAYTPTALSQAQRDSPVQTGPIIATGRIVTGDAETPLARVRVLVPGDDDAVQSQLTDQDGRFQIILPAGTSGLRLSKPGFAPLSVERRALKTGVDVMVRMARGGAINGMVTDSLGAPAVNMSVRVRRVNDGASTQGGSTQFSAETDDLGEFRVGNLPAGRYTVAPGGRGGRGPGGGALVDLLGGSRGEEFRALIQGIDQEQLRAVADSLGLQQELEFLGRGGRGDDDLFGRGGTPDGNNAGGDQNGNRGGGRGNRGSNQNTQGQQPQQGQAQGQTQGQNQNQTQTQAQGGQAQQTQGRGGRGRGGRGGDQGARGTTPTDPAANLPTVDVAAGQETSISLTIDDQGAAVLEQALRLAAAVSATRTATATAATAPGTLPAPTPAGEIRGKVLNAEGLPLKGATVQFSPAGGTGTRRSVVTDDAGRYELTAVVPGSYRARISKSGLPDVEYGQKRTLQPGRIITVADKQRVQGIDVKMPRASAFTGRLTDQWGEPIEGASLQVLQSTFTDGRTTLASVSGVRSRRTDDRGQYRLYGLLPGTYYLVASEQNGGGERGPDGEGSSARVFYPGTMSAIAATPVQVDAGQDAFGLDFTFTSVRASQIQGIAISSTSGEAARGRAILAVSERSGEPLLPLQTARVEEDGSFVFNGVAAGDYVVQVLSNVTQTDNRGGRGGNNRGRGGNDTGGRGGQTNQGGATQGRGGGRQGGGNTAAPQGGTTGGNTARQGGTPATAQPQSGAAGQANAGGGQRGGNAGQQGQGNRGNQQANSGRGRGTSTPARNIQRSDREFGVAYVTVNENEIASVRVDTAPGTPVTGQIVLEGDTSSTTLAASSFGFTAYGVSGDTSPLAGTRQATAQVQNDWTFLITDLIGANRFSMSRAPDGWYLKSATVNGQNAVDEPVSFDGGNQAVIEVTVTFASGAASLEGRVLDDRRQPTAEFGVVVFSSDPDRWFTRSPYLKFATPNQDGTYSVTGLPPAEYLVAALDQIDGGPDFGEWQNPNVLNTLAPTAKRVKLGAGEVVSAELRMVKMAR